MTSRTEISAAGGMQALHTARLMDASVTQRGESLGELCARSPLLLVFLRHAGCPFCRRALADLSSQKGSIERRGIRIVLIHPGPPAGLLAMLRRYGLEGVDRIADPRRSLYHVFGLARGGLRQLAAPQILWRGFQAAIVQRHGMGRPAGDIRQLSGVFLLQDAQLVRRRRHRDASERTDYLSLIREAR